MWEPSTVIYTVSKQEIIIGETITYIRERMENHQFLDLTILKKVNIRTLSNPNETNSYWRKKDIVINVQNITTIVPYGDYQKQGDED